MSITSGFFNSNNGDRKYNALQLSSIFDGVIGDGVFASIGTCFVTKAAGGLVVNVGIGKAWFNHTWIINDAILPLTMPASHLTLTRIDAIVLEINLSDNVRKNTIKIIQGTAAASPARPALKKSNGVYQYPICYIERLPASTVVEQYKITNMIGSTETPFVTGILQVISLDELLGQWQDELDNFVDRYTNNIEAWTEEQKANFLEWAANRKAAYDKWIADMKLDLNDDKEDLDNWTAVMKQEFTDWFDGIKEELGTSAVGNLQNQIDAITQKEFERYYALISKTTNIKKDSSGNVTSIVETSNEATATTTFAVSGTTTTITTALVPTSGNYKYTKTSTIVTATSGVTITESFAKTLK